MKSTISDSTFPGCFHRRTTASRVVTYVVRVAYDRILKVSVNIYTFAEVCLDGDEFVDTVIRIDISVIYPVFRFITQPAGY